MDYRRIYNEFIADRKTKPTPDGYTEKHHIVPRSLGGGDEPENLIRLTAREHYFAHCCLAKIHGGKMWSALLAVANMAKREDSWRYFAQRRMVSSSREQAAKERSKQMKYLWASGKFKRSREYRPWTEEEKTQRSVALMGRKNRPESTAKARATRMSRAKRHEYVHSDGREFAGTQFDFRQFSGLSQAMVSYLTVGKIATAKNWMLRGTDPRARNGRDPTVLTFRHKDGNEFSGTAFEFRSAYPHLDGGSISKMINGKLGTVNGWKLTHPPAPSALSISSKNIA